MARGGKRQAARQQIRQGKQSQRSEVAGPRFAPSHRGVVDRAERLRDRGDPQQARRLLEQRLAADPRDRKALGLLLDLLNSERDYHAYIPRCRQIIELEPLNPGRQLCLAGALLETACLGMALVEFRRFLAQWPNDPMAEYAAETVRKLEAAMPELISQNGFDGPEVLDLECLHEEALASAARGDFSAAVEAGERLRARRPDFLSGLNNLAQARFELHHWEQALALDREVLRRDPDNAFALANLARHLLLSGSVAEAEAAAARLRAVRADRPGVSAKLAETLSYFGDDEGVLAALEQARQVGETQRQTSDIAVLYHCAAVAEARLGRWGQARTYWEKALRIHPGLDLAANNLEDSGLLPAERKGPWAHDMQAWVGKPVFEELIATAKFGPAAAEKLPGIVERNPALRALIPALLDRGPPLLRLFARSVAEQVATPDMIAALHAFVRSQRGSDESRGFALQFLQERGEFARDSVVRMWRRGEWREIRPRSYEITSEPIRRSHSPVVEELCSQAAELTHQRQGAAAETLIRRAIELEGEQPDLLNNLAGARALQGDFDGSESLIRSVHARWPDYFFARAAMARLLLREGDVAGARKLLGPLHEKEIYHITEFAMLCLTEIDAAMAEDEVRAAEFWVGQLERADPDHPQLERLYELLD